MKQQQEQLIQAVRSNKVSNFSTGIFTFTLASEKEKKHKNKQTLLENLSVLAAWSEKKVKRTIISFSF